MKHSLISMLRMLKIEGVQWVQKEMGNKAKREQRGKREQKGQQKGSKKERKRAEKGNCEQP
jgi:hypothetical protein